MVTVGFDTHEFVKRLTEAGMPEEQAEVLARSQATLIDEELATKRGLEVLELAMKRDLEAHALAMKRDLEAHALAMKRDLEAHALATKRDLEAHALATKRDLRELELRLKHDLTLRLGSMTVAAVGVVAILVRFL